MTRMRMPAISDTRGPILKFRFMAQSSFSESKWGQATYDASFPGLVSSRLRHRSVRFRTYRPSRYAVRMAARSRDQRCRREIAAKQAQKSAAEAAPVRLLARPCQRAYLPYAELAEVTQVSFSDPDIASHLASATLYCASRVSARASAWASMVVLCALASATSLTCVACASFTHTSFSWAALGSQATLATMRSASALAILLSVRDSVVPL